MVIITLQILGIPRGTDKYNFIELDSGTKCSKIKYKIPRKLQPMFLIMMNGVAMECLATQKMDIFYKMGILDKKTPLTRTQVKN